MSKPREMKLPHPHWRKRALCADVDLSGKDIFYTDDDKENFYPPQETASLCGRCPVKRECLITAIATDEKYGTWGGLTRKQRLMLQRPRNRKKCPLCSGTLIHDAEDQFIQICYACGITWRRLKRNP